VARTYSPALNRQQFLQRKPGGNYGSYLQWLTRKRPDWDPSRAYETQTVPSPQVRGRIPTYEDLLRRVGIAQFETPAQLEARANRMAQTQLTSQRSIIADEYRQAQEDALRRMQAFSAAGNAATAMNRSLIPLVGAGYRAGADALSNMASGLGGDASGAVAGDVASVNAAQAAVGMPVVQAGGPVGAPGIAGPLQAGVEIYRGGTLPANAMRDVGGFAEAGLQGQIGAANLRSTQEAMAAYQTAMGEAQRSRSSAIKELIAGRPDNAMKFLSQLQDAQRQQIALAQGLIASRSQQGQQTWERGITQGQETRAQIAQNEAIKQQQIANQQWQKEFAQKTAQANQQAALTGRAVDQARSMALGYYVDATGNPILKNGKRIPVPKTIIAKTTGTPTVTEQRRTVLYEAQRLIANYTDRRGNIKLKRPDLINALKTTFPGIQKSVIEAIVNSLIPKTTGTGTGKVTVTVK